MITWFEEYKSSLKKIEAEEFLDILFFRPLGFIIVKIFYGLPLTPNHYSLMAFICGLISAVFFFLNRSPMDQTYGALFFLLFAILDCCDGMQARLKKNGSPLGRVIDGLVDWSINAVVYLALVFGALKDAQYLQAFLFFFAGATKAINSGVYDNQLMEYLSFSEGKTNYTNDEIDQIQNELKKDLPAFDRFAWSAYLFLLNQQKKKKDKDPKSLIMAKAQPEIYCRYNLLSLKLWSLVGPAVHIAIFIIAFLFHTPSILFIYCALFGVGWYLAMNIYQSSINIKVIRESEASL